MRLFATDISGLSTPRGRKCEVCVEVEAKYKCPGCKMQTCSLPCVKRHKTEKGCDGKRNLTEFVSIKNFTENNLLSDYQFLEGAARCASNASRCKISKTPFFPRSKHLDTLIKKARSKEIYLHLLSKGMSKRKENTSIFHYKDKCIYWRVKLVFIHEDAEYIIRRVKDTQSMKEVLAKYIYPDESDPIIRFSLRRYVDAWFDGIKIYMKKEKSKTKGYHEIEGIKPLVESLRHKTIIEYPTFFVAISGKDSQFMESEEEGQRNIPV